MSKNYHLKNFYFDKFFLKTLITVTIISANLTFALPLEPSIHDDSSTLNFTQHSENTKPNATLIAQGIVNNSGHTTTYSNKISLNEDSFYHGVLGETNTSTNSVCKFYVEYPPMHGELEIDETTVKFLYVPYSSNFNGPDSFGYFVINEQNHSKQRSKYKQILVNVQPIKGYPALKKSIKQPLWGFQHYLDDIKYRGSYPKAARLNFPATKSSISKELYIPYETKAICNDSPIAIGVVSELGNETISHTNQISLKEDSMYKGQLGVKDTTNNSTIKFALEYMPIHGIVEINEKTGEFSYVPNKPHFSGPDSFGYFISYFANNSDQKPLLRQKSKYKKIFVTVYPITRSAALKKTVKQPLWGFQHYLNSVKG